jgi:hypothetical protein
MRILDRHRCTQIVHKALAAVRPQFRLNFHHGVHGVPHWSRVWFHGRHLAESVDVDPAILAWFAYLHDSQRHNDNRDPLHGNRAADSEPVPQGLSAGGQGGGNLGGRRGVRRCQYAGESFRV